MLLAAPGQLATHALRTALLDERDTTTRLTAPLLPAPAKPMPPVPAVPEATAGHLTAAPVLANLQAAFENLAGHHQALGKLELLARAARLASFGLWVHVLNAGRTRPGLQPLLLCGPQPSPAMRAASHNGVGLMQQQVRRAYAEALAYQLRAGALHESLTAADYQSWAATWEAPERERFRLEISQKVTVGQSSFRAVC